MCRIRIILISDQDSAKLLPVKDIDTHGCQGAAGMCGLLFEVDDLVVLIGDHDAETGCFFHGDGHDRDGGSRTCLLVAVEHLVIQDHKNR